MKQLDSEKFREELLAVYDRISKEVGNEYGVWSRMGRRADVSNVGRIAHGRSGHGVDLKTWLKFHAAYPNEISEPSYIDGDTVQYGGVQQNGNVFTGSGGQSIVQGGQVCTSDPILGRLVELLKLTKAPIQLKQMVDELEDEVAQIMGQQKKMGRIELAV